MKPWTHWATSCSSWAGARACVDPHQQPIRCACAADPARRMHLTARTNMAKKRRVDQASPDRIQVRLWPRRGIGLNGRGLPGGVAGLLARHAALGVGRWARLPAKCRPRPSSRSRDVVDQLCAFHAEPSLARIDLSLPYDGRRSPSGLASCALSRSGRGHVVRAVPRSVSLGADAVVTGARWVRPRLPSTRSAAAGQCRAGLLDATARRRRCANACAPGRSWSELRTTWRRSRRANRRVRGSWSRLGCPGRSRSDSCRCERCPRAPQALPG